MPKLIVFFALLVLVLLAYACVIAALRTLHSSDPAGNGLTQAFGALMTIVLWVLLAGLLFAAGWLHPMPRWVAGVAFLLVPLSGVAALAAGQLLNDTFYHAKWPILIPVLLPLVLIGFALWNSFSGLRTAVPDTTASAVTWGAVLLLSIAPWPEGYYRARHGARDRAKAAADWKADEPNRLEAVRQSNLAAFRRLTPDSDFSEWLEFLDPANELRVQALAGIRRLPRRQAEFEALLSRGYDYLMNEVQNFDLEPTPVIAEAARHFLRQKVTDLTPRHPASPPQFRAMLDRIEPALPAIKWLVEHHCGCDPELDALERTVWLYHDSPERQNFLTALAAARQAP